jgi:hypothetical protein
MITADIAMDGPTQKRGDTFSISSPRYQNMTEAIAAAIAE